MASIPIGRVKQAIAGAIRNGTGKSASYRAEYDSGSDSLRLYHYGTLIYEDQRGRLVRLGGYSSSDRDAINSALHLRMSRDLRVSGAERKPSWATRNVDGWWVG